MGEWMNSKRKGNRGELELLHILQAHGIEAQRNQQGRAPGELMPKGGYENPDVQANYHGIPAHIEVKRVQRLNLYAAMAQAVRDAGHRLPVVAHRTNNHEWLVTIRLKDLL